MALTSVALIAAAVFLYARLGESGFAWTRFVAVLRELRYEWLVAALFLIVAAYAIRECAGTS